MTLRECEMVCLENCSCMAYTNLDIRGGGSGCLLWFGELTDIREYSADGPDIYIRTASSEVQQVGLNGKKRKIVVVTLAILIRLLLLGMSLIVYLRKRKMKNSQLRREGNLMHNSEQGHTDKSQTEDLELPLFDLAVIVNSTNNFSINNKLEKGGFEPVYKEHGLNLAKNWSDQTRRMLLDWPKRFHIINGISRGLLYLHQDSRLRIIHRDLKASNILLDIDMNPKILDFGLPKSFGGNETEANTKRVVRTYGYMSPEYAIDGLFSVKSDVFSFGVLMLEIVSGKKNRGFYHPGHSLNLLGHWIIQAWRLYEEGKSLELLDETLWDLCYQTEMLRSIHVGLLCVQESPEDRPSMSSVVLMLSSEATLPRAKQPGFFTARNVLQPGSSSSKEATTSANEITITLLSAR
ncbi:unnamed protein product [Camellia sinensis]